MTGYSRSTRHTKRQMLWAIFGRRDYELMRRFCPGPKCPFCGFAPGVRLEAERIARMKAMPDTVVPPGGWSSGEPALAFRI